MGERKEPRTSPRCLSDRAICGGKEGSPGRAHLGAAESEDVGSEVLYIEALASDSVMSVPSMVSSLVALSKLLSHSEPLLPICRVGKEWHPSQSTAVRTTDDTFRASHSSGTP